MIRYAVLVLCSISLCACSTRYQEMGLTGGVGAQQISGDTFRITSRGNGFTSAETVQDYTLLKAAEVTKAAGATHFAVVSEADASRAHLMQTGGTAQTDIIGNSVYTQFTPGSSITIIKPGEDGVYTRLQPSTGSTNSPRRILCRRGNQICRRPSTSNMT